MLALEQKARTVASYNDITKIFEVTMTLL